MLSEGTVIGRIQFLLATTTLTVASPNVLAQVRAQQLSGIVRDELGRSLADATIVVDSAPGARLARSDSSGRFRVSGIGAGDHLIRALRIGYAPFEQRIVMPREGLELEIVLSRITQLDTIPVRAQRSGVFGKVIARSRFEPIPGATVVVLGTGAQQQTGHAGDFDFPRLSPGANLIQVRHRSFLPRLISFVVPTDSAVELALVLESTEVSRTSNRSAVLFADFEARMKRRGTRSALIPRQELAGRYGLSLGAALRYSPSFARANLVLSDTETCVFVNGQPRPLATADDFVAGEVVAIEVYGLRQDHSKTLMDSWPPNAPCGKGDVVAPASSGKFGLQSVGVRPSRIRMDNVIRALVIWTSQQ